MSAANGSVGADKAPVRTTIEWTEKDLRDLLITALEQGCSYWAATDVSTDKAVFQLSGPGGHIMVYEHCEEDDSDEWDGHRVTHADLLAAFNKLPGHILGNIRGDQWDALDADAWFQCAVLGEVRYG